jgi:hypothetical protein
MRFLVIAFRRRLALQLEIVALRHQLAVHERSRPSRFRIEPGDRVLWSWLARLWSGWRNGLRFVRPAANRARVAETAFPRPLPPQESGRPG